MKIGYEEDLECKPDKVANFRHKWEETHTITYRHSSNASHAPPLAMPCPVDVDLQEGKGIQMRAASHPRHSTCKSWSTIPFSCLLVDNGVLSANGMLLRQR